MGWVTDMPPTLPEVEEIARRAGEILRAGFEHEHQLEYKGVIDLVTEVDHQSEAFLLAEIQNRFPGSSILAEESGSLEGDKEHLWYVDPLDGTVNYAHGIPIFCVSIGYAHRGVTTLGVVYDPLRDEAFTAERGRGAWLNGRPLHVSRVEELDHSLLVTGFPYDAWNSPRNNLEYFGRFARLTQGVRRLGSAALDLCYVAAGRFDGFWELSLKPWDVAAAGLIAEEAGALVTDIDGGPDYISPPQSILAAPATLHPKMLAVLHV
jgi:myo-inositol-1(or 4)-monophosphatase